MNANQIKANTRIRVIINGVILNGVTPRKLQEMLGCSSHDLAVEVAINQFNDSETTCIGILTRVQDVDIQIDLQPKAKASIITRIANAAVEA